MVIFEQFQQVRVEISRIDPVVTVTDYINCLLMGNTTFVGSCKEFAAYGTCFILKIVTNSESDDIINARFD
jgi:hypothetical protein